MKQLTLIFTLLISTVMFSSPSFAEVDIELLKQKYPKCENKNYRHECFDDSKEMDFIYIGYFRNNSLWDGQYFQNDILTYEFVDGEMIAKSFCKEGNDGWWICANGNRQKSIDGGYYDGEGDMQGKFILEFSSGNKYVGELKDSKRHGQGTYTYASGNKYVGDFKDNKRHGQGTYTWADGNKYVGDWQNGKKHGQGTFTFANGSKDVGAWEYGKLNGHAITYYADGSIDQEGIFKDDKFLYAQKKSKIDKHKEFCEEIGFTPKTEGFGNCVLELMKKD